MNPWFRTGVVSDSESALEVLDGLLAYVSQERPDCLLAFRRSSSDAPFTRALPEQAPRHGLFCHPFPGGISPIVRIEGDWERYLESRPRHVEHEWRRKIKRIEKAGRVERRTITALEDCPDAMRDVMRIEERSWKGELGIGIAADQSSGTFFEDFSSRAAAAGWLRLHLLYLDGQPVAHIYGVDYRRQFYAIKTSYDAAYRELSPGIVLFLEAVRSAFVRALDSVDLGVNDNRYKCELANVFEGNTDLCIGLPTVPCLACGAYRLKVKPFLKERLPLLVEAKRRLHALFPGESIATRQIGR